MDTIIPNWLSLSNAPWPNAESFIDSLPDIFFVVDLQGRLFCTNQRGLDEFGYRREEIQGLHISNLVVPEDRPSVALRFSRLIEGKPVSPKAYRMLRRDGTICICLVRAKAFYLDGRIYCICGFAVDLFEQNLAARRANRTLCANEAYLRHIINILPQGIHEVGTDGTIESCNPAFLRLIGYTREALIGKPVIRLIPDRSDRKKFEAYLQDIFTNYPSPSPWTGTMQSRHGERIDVKVDWTYRKNQNGQINGAIACITDITEALENRRKRYQNREQLEQKVAQRTRELSNANTCLFSFLLEKQTELITKQKELERLNRDLSESNRAITHLAKKLDRTQKTGDREMALTLSTKVLPIVKTLCSSATFQKYKSELETLKLYIDELTQPLENSERLITLLSPTEMRIAAMIKNGLPSSKIALKLYVSEDTVKVHRRNIRKKLGLTKAKINLKNYFRRKWNDIE